MEFKSLLKVSALKKALRVLPLSPESTHIVPVFFFSPNVGRRVTY